MHRRAWSVLLVVAAMPAMFCCSNGGSAAADNDIRPQTPLKSIEGFSGLTRENTGQVASALQRVRSGRGSGRVLILGDSVTAGSGTGSDGFYRDAAQRNFASLLASRLEKALGIRVSRDSFLGQNNIHGSYPDYNARVTSVGSFGGTGVNPRYTSLGGALFEAKSAGESLRYRPVRAADRFEIRYAVRDGASHLRYRIADGPWRTAAAGSGSRYLSAEVVLDRPERAIIEIAPESAGALLHGIVAHNSSSAELEIVAAGFAGSTATRSWLNERKPWSPLVRLEEEPADLKIIALGTNDINKDVEVSDYIAAMKRIIRAARKKSDVLVLAPAPLRERSFNTSAARQEDFRNALRELAAAEGIAFGDTFGWFGGSYRAASLQGLMSDSLHPSPLGAARIADFLSSYLGHVGRTTADLAPAPAVSAASAATSRP